LGPSENSSPLLVSQAGYGPAWQGCGVARSWRFLGGVGVFTTPGAGVGIFCPTSSPEVQLGHFLHHSAKLGIAVAVVPFLLKLLLKQIIFAVYHDFH